MFRGPFAKSISSILIGLILVAICAAGSPQTNTALGSRSEADIEALVNQLRLHPWAGPQNITNPTHWLLNFTEPMQKILEVGAPTQKVLLRYTGDAEIRDQGIILLGGVGDEHSIEPIINAMGDKEGIKSNPAAGKVNLAANLALTNITAAEVIWHRGGGISVDRCPDDPKSCWSDWWRQNKDHFQIDVTVNRNYSNYPNYGIYKRRNEH